MWQLIKTEIWYNRVFLVLLLLTPPSIYWVHSGALNMLKKSGFAEIPWGLTIAIGIILIIKYGLVKLRKEKRNRMFIMLPISAKKIGIARLLLSLSDYGILVLVVAAMWIVLWYGHTPNIGFCLSFGASVTIVYSLVYICNDIISSKRQQVLGGVIVALLGFNFLGFFLYRKANIGATPEWLTTLFNIIVRTLEASSTINGSLIFLAVSIVLAYISIETFARRKTYLE
jgi:hypothetical protein